MRLTEANVLALDPGHALLHPADDAAAALAAPHRHGVENLAAIELEPCQRQPAGVLYPFTARAEDGFNVAGATRYVTLRVGDGGTWLMVEPERDPARPDTVAFAAYRCHPPVAGRAWELLGAPFAFADLAAALPAEEAASDRWIVGIVPADTEEAPDADAV